MTNEDIIWEIKKNPIKALVESGKRVDGRAFDEHREIEIIRDFSKKAEGSCLVKLGNTQVLAGVKLSIGIPYPDTPAEGALSVGAELVPIAAPIFYSGPPNENAIELARVVDRGIRESKMIEMDKLVIEEGEKVWMVSVDLHVLDYDGNLFDASNIAAVNALLNTFVPKYEDDKIIREKQMDLPVREKPLSFTFVKIGAKNLLDPSLVEEKIKDAEMTITLTEDNHLCAMQKGGTYPYYKEDLDEMIDTAIRVSKNLRKKVFE